MSGDVSRDRLPRPVLALAWVAVAFFALPLVGVVVRAPWGSLLDLLRSGDVRAALLLSLQTSVIATAVSVVLGVPLGWVLARADFPGRSAVRALCTLSMVVPPVVGGAALLAAYGRSGFVGRWLDELFGWRLPFSTAGVVVAQVFVAMPFLVLSVEPAFRQLDRAAVDAARTLGASRWFLLIHVSLPLVRPALVAGAVLAWARSIGEFGATITFAGNAPGVTQTMPLATFLALETSPDEAYALAIVMIAVSFTVLIGWRERWTTP